MCSAKPIRKELLSFNEFMKNRFLCITVSDVTPFLAYNFLICLFMAPLEVHLSKEILSIFQRIQIKMFVQRSTFTDFLCNFLCLHLYFSLKKKIFFKDRADINFCYCIGILFPQHIQDFFWGGGAFFRIDPNLFPIGYD